ncbi:MAG: DUF456 domain-containing protein [Planctomycetota bacterium]
MELILLALGKVLASACALGGLILIPFGLPGNWIIALSALAGVGLGSGWPTFGLVLGGAALAEALEWAGTLFAARGTGAGRAGLWGAVVGGIVGAILGTPVLPILGTFLGAGLGAFAGAFLGEWGLARRGGAASLKAGAGAFVGTLAGKVLKIWIGLAQLIGFLLVLWGLAGGAG